MLIQVLKEIDLIWHLRQQKDLLLKQIEKSKSHESEEELLL